MEPTNHPFRKENHLPSTSMIMFQPLIFRGVVVLNMFFYNCRHIKPGILTDLPEVWETFRENRIFPFSLRRASDDSPGHVELYSLTRKGHGKPSQMDRKWHDLSCICSYLSLLYSIYIYLNIYVYIMKIYIYMHIFIYVHINIFVYIYIIYILIINIWQFAIMKLSLFDGFPWFPFCFSPTTGRHLFHIRTVVWTAILTT